jgi:DNA-binding NarL/FixJ family response regulator
MPNAVDAPILVDDVEEEFPSAGRRMRVLLADDHTILRQGLASLLANEPDMETIAEASTGAEAVELTRMLRPDVIVMDASMPEMSGLEATRHIMERFPQTLVVGLSMYDSEDMSDAMRAAGARAYVTKEKASEELCSVIRSIAQTHRRPHPSSRSTAAPSGRTTGRRASSSKP